MLPPGDYTFKIHGRTGSGETIPIKVCTHRCMGGQAASWDLITMTRAGMEQWADANLMTIELARNIGMRISPIRQQWIIKDDTGARIRTIGKGNAQVQLPSTRWITAVFIICPDRDLREQVLLTHLMWEALSELRGRPTSTQLYGNKLSVEGCCQK